MTGIASSWGKECKGWAGAVDLDHILKPQLPLNEVSELYSIDSKILLKVLEMENILELELGTVGMEKR